MTDEPSIEAVAGEVSEALRAKGAQAILVGGAVVTIYSENEYKSFDLDFVVRGRDRDIVLGMGTIGFKRGRGRHFERAGTLYLVEFLNPPPGIGKAVIQDFAERKTPAGLLTLYEPTHCVMDRLVAFYHWSDQQGLEQAIMVARRHRIREGEVRRWSINEGHLSGYEEYRARLKETRERTRESC